MAEPGVCVVTGAAGAVGQALVGELCQRGYRIAALGRSHDAERLEALRSHGAVLPLTLDAANPADWRGALETITRELGAPTGAALVAGGWRGGKPVHEEPDEIWDAMLAMNLATARSSLKALLAGMIERGSGSIVLFGSRAAERPWESARAAAYAASKAAVVALAQAAGSDSIQHGVRVNALLPSTVDTPQNRAAMPGADFSRWVSTASLADVVHFLLSDASRDVSGAALPVYGRA